VEGGLRCFSALRQIAKEHVGRLPKLSCLLAQFLEFAGVGFVGGHLGQSLAAPMTLVSMSMVDAS
jgi:hypothetical protein